MKFLKKIIYGWKSIFAAIRYRFDDYEWWEWERDFWIEINIGYYENYIFPYDIFPSLSKERELRLAQKPPTIYLSPEDFDSLVDKLNSPPDLKALTRFEKIMRTPAPWDESK